MTAKLWRKPDRPKYVIQAAPWIWRDGDTETPGVGLILQPSHLVQYLTQTEAFELANQLVDAAEAQPTQTKETHHV